MIDEAVSFIRREIRDHLGVPDTEVIIGNVQTLKEDNKSNGVYISLVNIEEESALNSIPHRNPLDRGAHRNEPQVFLNLYLLFAFDFADYGVSLQQLARTIELFQSKPAFPSQNETPTITFPPKLDRLSLSIQNLSFEQLNHIWGVLGASYSPSVLYKARLAGVQRGESTAAPAIRSIENETTPR